jgi:osmotically-inducible protein OsmY
MVTTTQAFSDFADRELERRVVATLVARNFPGLRRLHVTADRGEVTIAGRVRSFYEKQLAQHVARRVAGVIRLVDAIQVVEPPRPAIGSRWALSPAVTTVLSQRRFSAAGGQNQS